MCPATTYVWCEVQDGEMQVRRARRGVARGADGAQHLPPGDGRTILEVVLHHSGRTGEEARIYAQAMCFVNLLLIEKFTALSCRSERNTVIKIGFFGNKWLLLAIVGTMALSLPIIYVPGLQDYFHTYSLSLADWGIVALASCTLFVVVEGAKLFCKWRERASSGQRQRSPG